MKLVSLAVRRWSSNYTAVVVLSAEVYVFIARSFYQFIKGRKALRADDISAHFFSALRLVFQRNDMDFKIL